MKHIVLARKWRPKQFKDLVGQVNSIKVLTNIIEQNRLHHAYLLTGTRGVGKTTIARIIAKALNCLSPVGYEPCTHCENCVNIEKGSFVDVIEIDAASNTGVDNIREIIENTQYMPSQGKYKIFIIDEVHMLSKSAFNAMLKTLEEPPGHVIFILATTDLQKVPITIISRCLQLKLKNLLPTEISNHLAYILEQENIGYEKEALNIIAHAAHGSMRDALSILDQAIAFSDNFITELTTRQMLGITDENVIADIIDALANKNSTQLMKCINNIQTNGYDYETILSLVQNKLVELQLAQLTKSHTNLQKYVNIISVNDVQLYFEIATLGIENLKNAYDKYPIFVMTLLRMLAFTIGSNHQKELVIQNTNFTTITTEPNITTPKTIFNEENKLSTAKSLITTTNNQSIESDNSAEQNMSKPNIGHTYNGNWVELLEQIKPNIPSNLIPMLENSKIINHNDKVILIIEKCYEAATNHGDNKIQLISLVKNYFANKNVDIEFTDTVDSSLKNKTLQENQNKQLQAIESITNDPKVKLLINEYGGEIIKDSIKPVE